MAHWARLKSAEPLPRKPDELVHLSAHLRRAPQAYRGRHRDARDDSKLNEAARDPRLVTEHLPLKKSPYLDVAGCPVTVEQLFSRGINLPDFQFDKVEVPAFLIGGWFDIASNALIEEFRALRSSGDGGEKV